MAHKVTSIEERIELDHERLRNQSNRLLKTLEIKVPELSFLDWKMEMLARLRDYEHQLKKHFDIEEHGGFMERVRRKAPHHVSRVERLEKEHEHLLSQLDRSIRILKGINAPCSAGISRVQGRIRKLIEQLNDHEQIEHELLQDIYYTDYGSGD